MSQAVAVSESHPTLASMTKHLLTLAQLAEGSSEFVMDVMEKILTAGSVDEVFAAQENSGMISGKDFTNTPFEVASLEDIQWLKSSQANVDQGGYPTYALIRATNLLTGDEVTLNCGGKTFVATLYALIARDYFNEPRSFVIIAKTSPAGAYLQLQPYRRPEVKDASKKR